MNSDLNQASGGAGTALVVGLDAGGTRTRAVLAAAADGALLGEGAAGPGNALTVPLPQLTDHLTEAVARAVPQAARVRVVAVAGGFAGATGADEDDPGRVNALTALTAALGRLGISPAAITLSSDIEAAFASAPGTPADGLALVAGTGAVAMRITDRHCTATVDGDGWLLGDDGSGFWLGREAVRAALRMADGRGATTVLAETVGRALGLPAEVLPGGGGVLGGSAGPGVGPAPVGSGAENAPPGSAARGVAAEGAGSGVGGVSTEGPGAYDTSLSSPGVGGVEPDGPGASGATRAGSGVGGVSPEGAGAPRASLARSGIHEVSHDGPGAPEASHEGRGAREVAPDGSWAPVGESLRGPDAVEWSRDAREGYRRCLLPVVMGEPPVRLARFAPLVGEAARGGDVVARGILDRAVDRLAETVAALGPQPGERVVATGGLLGPDGPLSAALTARLQTLGLTLDWVADGCRGAVALARLESGRRL